MNTFESLDDFPIIRNFKDSINHSIHAKHNFILNYSFFTNQHYIIYIFSIIRVKTHFNICYLKYNSRKTCVCANLIAVGLNDAVMETHSFYQPKLSQIWIIT